MKHFLCTTEASAQELSQLLSVSADVKAHPDRYATALRGLNVALIFMKPSTRTRISFEVGVNQLGGHAVVLAGGELQLGRGETVADTARVLSRYVDGVMARVFGHQVLVDLADAGAIPVINGLSDQLHPCQALCDYFTMQEVFGQDLAGRKLAYIGDGNNMAHSLMLAGAQLGVNVTVGAPAGYQPDPAYVEQSRGIAAGTGARIEVVDDPVAAARDADVIYTDVWASMGQEKEREIRLAAFAGWQVTAELFEHARPDAVFMHCLPAHRGEEVSADVIDSERSIVFDQAENRLHTQKALMIALFGRP